MELGESFLHGQRLDPDRYALVPRTLTFLERGGQILLLRLAEDRGEWAGRYNGIGGHIERGEDPLSAARREVAEESGLQAPGLKLCGVVAVDPGSRIGIGLYVFVGEPGPGTIRPSAEGTLEWASPESMAALPLVSDMPFLLPRALAAYRQGTTFSAAYQSTAEGTLQIVLG